MFQCCECTQFELCLIMTGLAARITPSKLAVMRIFMTALTPLRMTNIARLTGIRIPFDIGLSRGMAGLTGGGRMGTLEQITDLCMNRQG